MRIFVAVHPGERLCREVSARLDPWRTRLPVRWTRMDNWHLTLQFLGEWPDQHVNDLLEALPEAGEAAPFRLRPGGLGAFPDLRRPRVLFLQLEGDGQDVALAKRIRGIVDRVWPDGPQDLKPYRAHLTLARVRVPLTQSDIKSMKDIDLNDLSEVSVEGFSLVASELLPEGPRHRDLGFWRLRKKGE